MLQSKKTIDAQSHAETVLLNPRYNTTPTVPIEFNNAYTENVN
jgi:hypothetical protein